MNQKTNKLIFSFFVIFIFINAFINLPVFATGNGGNSTKVVVGTIAKILITSSQVIVTGFFTIKLTIVGIQYFTAVAGSEKAAKRGELRLTLILGVIAILGMYLFMYAVENI